ncbi:MAG: hypothetical protein WC050_03835 [Candidatus Paceibacterota bacterium]
MTATARLWHRSLLRAALAGAQVFGWIFVFQFFFVRSGSIAHAVSSLALTYALTHVVVILLTPLAARRLRNGFKRLIVYAALSLSAAFAILAASFAGYLGPIGWGIGLFAILLGVYRALYWIPYEVARERTPGYRNRFVEAGIAVVPALAGLFLTTGVYAPVALLSMAVFVIVISMIPIAFMDEQHEGYEWRYRETFHELFASARRRMLFESISSGIEMATLLILWPLVVFLLLGWSYPMLGIVLSLTYVVAIVLRSLLKRPLNAT